MALPLVGLEPTILGLGGRCLIHWATEACWLAARAAEHMPAALRHRDDTHDDADSGRPYH